METFDIEKFRELLKEYKINRWKITDKQMHTWERLDAQCPREITTDCAVNVATFLNLLDRPTASILSRRLNVEQKGVAVGSISHYIYEDIIRSEFVKTQHELHFLNFDNSILELLVKHIGINHATIMELQKDAAGSTHCAILAVTKNGEPLILDPQQQVYIRPEKFEEYMNTGGFLSFGFYFRLKREKRLAHETSKRVRKPSPEQHTRKRRRMGSTPPPLPAREPSESMERSESEPVIAVPVRSSKKKGNQKRGKSKGKSQKRSASRSNSQSASQSMSEPLRILSPVREEGEVSSSDEIDYPRDVSPAFQPNRIFLRSRSPSESEYDPGSSEPLPEPLPVPKRPTRYSARKK